MRQGNKSRASNSLIYSDMRTRKPEVNSRKVDNHAWFYTTLFRVVRDSESVSSFNFKTLSRKRNMFTLIEGFKDCIR